MRYWRILLVVFSVLTYGAGLFGCSPSSKTETKDPGIVDDLGKKADGNPGEDVKKEDDEFSFDGWKLGDYDIPSVDLAGECMEAPYEFGCPCESNLECGSGYCVEGPFGFVCTDTCFEECPEGWHCKGLSGFGVDMVFLCVPQSKKLCYPCAADSQCGGGVCVELDEASYCAYQCDPKSPCPASFSCQGIIKNEVSMEVCLPDSGSCECTSNTEGQLRPCTKENDFGACVGYEKCDSAVGWVECNAPEPEGESCDGKDNDCDGLFDEEVPESMECENTVDGVGTCAGMSVCNGPFGWVCNAAVPEPEICDFKDNNCDGEVDEDYKTDGLYTHHNHCGTCNVDCTGAINNATAICDSTGGSAQCVVEECEEGYYKLNDFQCMPEGQTLCKPCLNDLGCEGGKCVTIFGGQYCTQSCAINPCPDTFECLAMDDLSGKWCVPVSGSCDCSKDTAGATKPCSSANGFGTCYGFEVCDPEIGWVDCGRGRGGGL